MKNRLLIVLVLLCGLMGIAFNYWFGFEQAVLTMLGQVLGVVIFNSIKKTLTKWGGKVLKVPPPEVTPTFPDISPHFPLVGVCRKMSG